MISTREKEIAILATALLIGLSFATFFSPAKAESEAVNLLKNAGFEAGLLGWHSTKELNPPDTATFAADIASHSGAYCAKGTEASAGNLGRLYQDMTEKLVAGWQYKITGWIKTQDVTGSAVIGLDYVNARGWTPSGDSYVMEVGYVTGTQEWTRFESEWFALKPMPPGVDNVALWFLFDFNAGSGVAWWDDVALLGNPRVTEANIDVDPDTINLRSRGKWITAYIEPPEGFDVDDVDVSTIRLNDAISVDSPAPIKISDYDGDGVRDLMVKFDRAAVMALLSIGNAPLTITGEVNEIPFEGIDIVRVIGK